MKPLLLKEYNILKNIMKTINKKDLIESVTSRTGQTKAATKKTIEAFLHEIKLAVWKKSRIEIRGFGVFYPVLRKARKIKSPVIKKEVETKDTWVLRYKMSKTVTGED